MRNSDSAGGCLAILMVLGHIAAWACTGLLAWNWVEPSSFGEALIFLLVWGIMGKVLVFVLGMVILGIVSLFS